MSWRRKLMVLLLAVAALGSLVLIARSIADVSPTSAQRTGPMRPPDALEKDKGFDPQPVEGLPALQPSRDRSTIGNATPAFTEEDVQSFISSTNAQGLLLNVNPDTPVTVRNVEFLNDRDLRARHHGKSSGLHEDTLLCYIELDGSFAQEGPPPGLGPEDSGPEQCGRAVVVLHAHTGNLLLSGIDCNAR